MSYINKEDLLQKITAIINSEDEEKSIIAGRILQVIIDFNEEDVIKTEDLKTYLHNLSTSVKIRVDAEQNDLVHKGQNGDKDYIDGYIDAIIDVKNKHFTCPRRFLSAARDGNRFYYINDFWLLLKNMI